MAMVHEDENFLPNITHVTTPALMTFSTCARRRTYAEPATISMKIPKIDDGRKDSTPDYGSLSKEELLCLLVEKDTTITNLISLAKNLIEFKKSVEKEQQNLLLFLSKSYFSTPLPLPSSNASSPLVASLPTPPSIPSSPLSLVPSLPARVLLPLSPLYVSPLFPLVNPLPQTPSPTPSTPQPSATLTAISVEQTDSDIKDDWLFSDSTAMFDSQSLMDDSLTTNTLSDTTEAGDTTVDPTLTPTTAPDPSLPPSSTSPSTTPPICKICLVDELQDRKTFTLCCTHEFHLDCLAKSFQSRWVRKRCVVCSKEFVSKDITDVKALRRVEMREQRKRRTELAKALKAQEQQDT